MLLLPTLSCKFDCLLIQFIGTYVGEIMVLSYDDDNITNYWMDCWA